MSAPKSIAVIGGGPAGLRAAEVAATAGASVTLYDGKPSVGRKFLVAGKSGLNLTNNADFDALVAEYSGDNLPSEQWRSWLAEFDNEAIRDWAARLGVETFAATSGKVFPTTKKAAPLLRRWVERLRSLGVKFVMNHRWTDLQHGAPIQLQFGTPENYRPYTPHMSHVPHDAVILALGGGSWPETGSDGTWVSILEKLGIEIAPLCSANCGWECDWTETTRGLVEGKPLHNLEVRAGESTAIGEIMLTRYGMEGTLIYALGRSLRKMSAPEVCIDFKPMFSVEQLVRKMESVRRNFLHEARERWKLTEAACALLAQFHGSFDSAESLAAAAKACRIPLLRSRPLAEAISTAGGVCWSELDENLMLKKLPGVFCAGEMIDWEAPTGGYLLQACFATGTRAGKAAVR